ncbi:MAG: hypothetical protein NWT00_00670 [Beijerinckiaceae bacterium]|jgi:YHS domain-containing protein|nr:hypothetical protein [Beijerinckiaceae bacterium]
MLQSGVTRRLVLTAMVGTLAFAVVPAAFAAGKTRNDLNLDKAGVAVHGYDPVAYFTMGKPVKGDAAISASHDGATYYFSSTANRQLFQKSPTKYKPAFGGFCAIGASLGKKFDGRPDLWKIVDGQLYLNVAPGPHKRWLSEIPSRIKEANANWPKIKDQPAAKVNAQ